MIRDEKQRQLDAINEELMEQLKEHEAHRAALIQEYAIVHAWLDGYDEGVKAGEADTIEAIFPPPEEMPFPTPNTATIGGSEHVEHEVLEVLSTGRQVSLEQLRRSFGWSHFETDNAVAHLFATGKITLGRDGYRLRLPGDESFAQSADDDSPSRLNGDGLA